MAFTYGAQEVLHLFGVGVGGMARTRRRSSAAQHSQPDGVQTQPLEEGGDRDGLQVREEPALRSQVACWLLSCTRQARLFTMCSEWQRRG